MECSLLYCSWSECFCSIISLYLHTINTCHRTVTQPANHLAFALSLCEVSWSLPLWSCPFSLRRFLDSLVTIPSTAAVSTYTPLNISALRALSKPRLGPKHEINFDSNGIKGGAQGVRTLFCWTRSKESRLSPSRSCNCCVALFFSSWSIVHRSCLSQLAHHTQHTLITLTAGSQSAH